MPNKIMLRKSEVEGADELDDLQPGDQVTFTDVVVTVSENGDDFSGDIASLAVRSINESQNPREDRTESLQNTGLSNPQETDTATDSGR